MKVNIIIPFTNLTGGLRVIFLYANYLASKGHDVNVYVPMIAYKTNKSFIKWIRSIMGNTFKRGRKISWFKCNFKMNLVPVISNIYVRNADISIATAWCTAEDVYRLSDKKGKKVYFIQDYEVWCGDKNQVDRSYELDLNRVVITKNLQDIMLKKFKVNSTLIFNGLDEGEFLKKEKIVKNKKTILMLYNEASNKGTKEGIEVLKNIYDKNNVKVILFGYPKRNDIIPSEFEYYENASRSKIIELYRNADIYLFPSKYESWGLPVLEAMSNKCAVVGNNTGCLSEIGVNYYNCLKVDHCDYSEMEAKVNELIENEELLQRIQLNGYELSQKFSWKNSYVKFEKYLFSLLENN